jgi:hypothetical protein
MRKISKIATLFIINLVIFIILFAAHVFDAYVFKSVSIKISHLPISSLLKTLLITSWMVVPQSILLFGLNNVYLRIPNRKFLITQILFAVSIVVVLFISIRMV